MSCGEDDGVREWWQQTSSAVAGEGPEDPQPEDEHAQNVDLRDAEAVVPRAKGRVKGPQITARDLQMLTWLACHRFATVAQLRARFGLGNTAAYVRLRKLRDLGVVVYQPVLYKQPGVYLTTRAGLGLTGVDLAPATVHLRTFVHSLAVVDLAVELESSGLEVISEREARAIDTTRDRLDLRYAIAVGGMGAGQQLHFPDLVIVHPDGEHEAVEVELSPKDTRRLERILAAYVAARHLAHGVSYHTPNRRIADQVHALARRLHASDLIRARVWNPPSVADMGALAVTAGVRT